MEPTFCANCLARGSEVEGPPGGPAIDLTDLVEDTRQDESVDVYYIRYHCSECETVWLYNHELDGETMIQVGSDSFKD